MEFIINGDMWFVGYKSTKELIDIYMTQFDEKPSFVFGLTVRSQNRIWLNNDMQVSQQIKTLKHELTHCYIWESGLYYVPNFDEEMACDLVSRSNDFINEVIDKFKNGGSKLMKKNYKED